jgi:hypothetical protein
MSLQFFVDTTESTDRASPPAFHGRGLGEQATAQREGQ